MRSTKKYLQDIVRTIDQMREHTDGKTLDMYLRELPLRAVAEQSLTVVTEALSQIGHQDPAIAGKITGYREWVRMRTFLVELYFDIDNKIVWETVQRDAPILQEESRELLADNGIR